LAELVRDQPPGEEARARVRSRCGDEGLELVWQQEVYDGSLHYDVLLDAGADGVISVSLSPVSDLPWPMRGVRRWSEEDLGRVGERVVKVQEAIAFLDFIWNETRILDRLVDRCLVEEAVRRQRLEPTDEDLQQELDDFRRRRGLEAAQAMRDWMARENISHEQLEQFLEVDAGERKLRRHVSAGRVESYFDRHRDDFCSATLATLAYDSESEAAEARARIHDASTFYAEAERRIVEGGAPFVVIERAGASALADAAFAAAAGEIIGPVPVSGGTFALARVLGLKTPELD
jgi:putative peptide maturation system protein